MPLCPDCGSVWGAAHLRHESKCLACRCRPAGIPPPVPVPLPQSWQAQERPAAPTTRTAELPPLARPAPAPGARPSPAAMLQQFTAAAEAMGVAAQGAADVLRAVGGDFERALHLLAESRPQRPEPRQRPPAPPPAPPPVPETDGRRAMTLGTGKLGRKKEGR